MKPLYALVVFCLLISQLSTAQTNKMPGSYKMLKQSASGAAGDTAFTNDQFKIYTDDHFIFVVQHTNDSLCEYGIGTYKNSGNSVLEKMIHSTFSDIASSEDIVLKITKLPKGYRQAIVFKDSANRDYLLTEDYENVSKKMTSPLDGAWKQTKFLYFSKTDSLSFDDIRQYKVYQSGHFVWASTRTDSATSKPISFFGYGTFKMDGKNSFTEINQNSTFASELVGKPMLIKLEMMGPDAFQQTTVSADGSIGKESYERMK